MKMSLTKSDLKAVKSIVEDVVDPKINNLETRLVGGMNQMVETLIDHMDERFDEVDDKVNKLELTVRSSIDRLDNHAVRISKLENPA